MNTQMTIMWCAIGALAFLCVYAAVLIRDYKIQIDHLMDENRVLNSQNLKLVARLANRNRDYESLTKRYEITNRRLREMVNSFQAPPGSH